MEASLYCDLYIELAWFACEREMVLAGRDVHNCVSSTRGSDVLNT